MQDKNYTNHIKIIAVIILIIGLVWFINKISWVIQLFVISLVIVYALYPLSEYLKRRLGFSHFLSVVATFTLLLVIIAAIIGLVFPIVQQEVQDILRDTPFLIFQLQGYLEELIAYLATFNISPEYMESIMELPANIQPIIDEVAQISLSVVGMLVDVFFIMFIVFYLLYDFHNVRNAAMKLVPEAYRRQAEDIIKIVDVNFDGYIRGNIVRCTIVGIITGLLLHLFGTPYALLLGILAGILNIILYIGPYMAAIPAVLLSFSPLTPSPFVIIVIYVGIQVLDGIILSPLLLGRAVKLKAITVIVCLLIGQQLAGFLGMVLSTPLAGIARSLLVYFKNERDELFPGK